MDALLSRLSRKQITAISATFLCILGIIDILTGTELSFSVFYIVPIFLVTWYVSRKSGYIMAALSALIWMSSDIFSGTVQGHTFIHTWNTSVRLAFFSLTAFMLSVIKDKLDLEAKLADTDPLTDLSNRRHFQECCDAELTRARRYGEPFTIMYIDLDNFKYVNDTQGHEVGDDVLREVAKVLKENLRHADISARLGGDEFAGLYPVTNNDAADNLIKKIHPMLNEAMERNEWPITFSIGAVSFEKPVNDSRELIKMVDETMYNVKKNGKNNILHVRWPRQS